MERVFGVSDTASELFMIALTLMVEAWILAWQRLRADRRASLKLYQKG